MVSDKLGPYELNTIITGDARELSKAIPDESVDLIFTDPPYPKEFLSLYEWLSCEASRVLKNDGFLLAYAGHLYFRQIQELLESNMEFYTLLCIWEPGMNSRIFPKHIITGWRPVFMMRKKDSNVLPPWIPDSLSSTFRDKRYHNWGQNLLPARTWIRYLCPSDGIVFEPFAGGGTTLAACKQIERLYLAFEIEPEVAEQARIRIEQTQPPLFVTEPEPQQATLFATTEAIR